MKMLRSFLRASPVGTMLLFSFIASCVWGQDPLNVFPSNYRLVFENDCVSVIQVVYRPFEKLPVHNHSDKPTVYVYLSDSGPVRFSHVEEHSFSLVRPAEKAGTFRFSPGRLEKHTVENLGDIPSEFLRVELKQLPLGYHGESFRSPKSFDTSHSGVRTEFDSSSLKIQRIIATTNEVTDVQGVSAPALLVAFSPTSLQAAGEGERRQTMVSGDVFWMEAKHAFRIRSDGTAAADLLRIIVGGTTEPRTSQI